MPKVYNIGPRFYAQVIPYPIKWSFKTFFQVGHTSEIEEPFRVGKSVVVHFWKMKAFVLGMWTGVVDETEALTTAMMGTLMSLEELEDAKENA